MNKLTITLFAITVLPTWLVAQTPENEIQTDNARRLLTVLLQNTAAAEYGSDPLYLRQITLPVPAAPIAVIPSRRKTVSELLSEQEEYGNKKFYTPQEIFAMIREDYGDTPADKDRERFEKGFNILKGTKFGAEMCASIAYGCSFDSLQKAGISLRVKDGTYGENQTFSGSVPQPIQYAGRTFIGISKKALEQADKMPQYLALTLLHEMSHVQDLRRYTKGTLEKAKYESDQKAVMSEIACYDELTRKYPGFSDSLYDFLLEVWAWKNESGSYPRHRFFTLPLGPNGQSKVVSTGELLNNYMPGISFLDSLERFVYVLWHPAYGDPKKDPNLVKTIKADVASKASEFKSWREAPGSDTGSDSNSGGTNYNGNGNNNYGGGSTPQINPPNFGGGTGLDHPGAGSF